jgi:hypothetical protein
LLDAQPAPPAPSEATLQRVSATILAEMAEERRRPRPSPGPAWLTAAGALAAWVVFLAAARQRLPVGRSWAMSIFVLALAAVAAAGARRFGRLAAVAALGLSSLFTLAGSAEGGLQAALGAHCVLIELMSAALPLGTTAYLALHRRAGWTEVSSWTFAGAAAAGALAGQAALHQICPAHGAAHLTVFHTGGVLLATAIGVVTWRLLQGGPRFGDSRPAI